MVSLAMSAPCDGILRRNLDDATTDGQRNILRPTGGRAKAFTLRGRAGEGGYAAPRRRDVTGNPLPRTGDRVVMRRQTTLGVLAAPLSSLWGLPAGAQPRPRPAAARAAGTVEVEGAVLAIQGEELVLDLGSSRGAAEGMSA